ncbi:MAG: DegT/DnrJ/EryC1/StrS family aminotransferase [Vicinamibacteria bacterium]
MAPIPMVDLRAQHDRIGAEVDAAVARVIASAHFIRGEECSAFEKEFADYCGATHGCGVANGTDALTIALRAHGVGPGDEVVTVANTFMGTGEAILLNGARPVFVDVDPETFTMDPSLVEGAITPRTKLILPVHLYGHPADMAAIEAIAARHGIPVLEDAAQAHGARVGERRAGNLAHAACFSFYPAKNLGAYGDAGMVVSSDGAFIDRVRQIANHGGRRHYEHNVLGTNSRLDTIQAAVLRAKLRHLDAWNEERRALVALYDEGLAEAPHLRRPRERPDVRSAWHLYTVRVEGRDALRASLEQQGIATAVHYPVPIHLQPALAALGGRPGDLPVSEQLSREVLSLPLYPELPSDSVERIAAAVKTFRHEPAVRH